MVLVGFKPYLQDQLVSCIALKLLVWSYDLYKSSPIWPIMCLVGCQTLLSQSVHEPKQYCSLLSLLKCASCLSLPKCILHVIIGQAVWEISRFLANVNSCSRSLYVVVRPSVCRLSVCRLSVTFVHPTQPIEIFGNVSAPCNTLVTWWHPGKILRRSSQGNPSVGGLNQRVLEKM